MLYQFRPRGSGSGISWRFRATRARSSRRTPWSKNITGSPGALCRWRARLFSLAVSMPASADQPEVSAGSKQHRPPGRAVLKRRARQASFPVPPGV
jgi:hypothetical protein